MVLRATCAGDRVTMNGAIATASEQDDPVARELGRAPAPMNIERRRLRFVGWLAKYSSGAFRPADVATARNRCPLRRSRRATAAMQTNVARAGFARRQKRPKQAAFRAQQTECSHT
jgi:hypothetical protein